MLQTFKTLLVYTMLTTVLCIQASNIFHLTSTTTFGPTPLIIPRSQSVDSVRELVGWQQAINRCDEDCWYGAFSFTSEYEQSFRGAQMARCLFGNDVFINNNQNAQFMCSANTKCGQNECATLTVSGSQVNGRGAHDWLADYFGLPTDFKSVVNFCPRIQNAIFDFNFYFGLDELGQGLFFRMHFPLVWTKWSLHASELVLTSTAPGINDYIPGYMAATRVPNTNLQKSFLMATDGVHGRFGDLTADLKYGIIGADFNIDSINDSCNNHAKGRSLARFSDIECALGVNFLCDSDYHVGLDVRVWFPAGNTPTAQYVFEPIVGNGHYVTFGGGLTSHYTFWRACDDDSALGVWFDANITHLFKNKQMRSFDFLKKPNSRYALLEEFRAPPVDLLVDGVAPSAQYKGQAGNLKHAINITTVCVTTSFDVQADLALKFGYQRRNWELDLGYNFWIRSSEKIFTDGMEVPADVYALKGDAQIYGFLTGLIPESATALSATESLSTINAGTNTPIGTPFNTLQYDNPNIDAPALATNGAALSLFDGVNVGEQQTSFQPILLTSADVDFRGAPRATTHRIFAHFNYMWNSCDDWVPFLGFGLSAEFANSCGSGHSCNATAAGAAINSGNMIAGENNCAISQWAIWLKTGVSYN